MEFITLVHPSGKDSTSLKRQAHSHAARVAHARARRQRMASRANQKLHVPDEDPEQPASEDNSTTHMTIVRRQQGKQHICLDPKLIITMPETISGAFEHEPLASFMKSLTPREHYIFDHYVKKVVPDMQAYCPVITYLGPRHQHVRDNWTLLLTTNLHLLQGCLLAACRHLYMVHQKKDYEEIAVRYKLNLLRSLRDTLSKGDVAERRTAVTRALVLTLDEIMLHDLVMASKHVWGAVRIVEAAGGAEALGLSDLERVVMYSCMYGKRLLYRDWDLAVECDPKWMTWAWIQA